MTVKREIISDGIFSSILVTVEAMDASDEAGNALFGMLETATPHSRIAALEHQLVDLPGNDAGIALRAEKIREIIAELKDRHPDLMLDLLGLEKLKTAEMWFREVAVLREVVPLSKKGRKFPPGRTKGAVGPIAKAVNRYLSRNPEATALDVWGAIKKKPPSGYSFMENTHLGRYIEGPQLQSTGWGRFNNIVSEQRPKKDNK